MALLQTPTILTALAVVVSVLLYRVTRWVLSTGRPAKFPPGPPTLPGLGNLHLLPRELPFLKYDAWAKEYGPLTGLKFGPLNVVVINDASLLYEMIIKQGAAYAGRPPRYIGQQKVIPEGQHTYVLFLRNDYSRRLRTVAKPFITGPGLKRLQPMQKAAGTHLISNLVHSTSENWADQIVQWGVTTPIAMLTGTPVTEFGPDWIHEYHKMLDLMEELVDPAKSPPVDIYPILRWVPAMFADWKRKAPMAAKAMNHAYNIMMHHAKKDHHNSFGSMISKLLERSADPSTPSEERFSEVDIKWMMGGMLDAAVDSSVVTFQILLLALASNQDAQRKAQAEVDAVFGPGNTLPDAIDLDQLPYLNACVTEGLRWRPVSPLGLPRETLADQDVQGYHIPNGTMVLLNQWTIQQDADFYDEPYEYRPERYLRDPLGAKPGVSQIGRKALYTFGAGRRECPGTDFFFQNIRIAVSQILWAFNIEGDGPLDTDVDTAFVSSVMLRPKPFKLKFVPRRAGIPSALLEEKGKADMVLNEILS